MSMYPKRTRKVERELPPCRLYRPVERGYVFVPPDDGIVVVEDNGPLGNLTILCGVPNTPKAVVSQQKPNDVPKPA